MADTNIDTLTIKITANAQSASSALKSLANSLKKVHEVLTGFKDGQYVTDRLADSFKDLNEALNKISTSAVKKLQKLAAALNEYTAALDRAKKAGIGGLAKGLKSMDSALGGDTKSGEAESEGSAEKTNDKANATKKLGDETEKAGKKAQKAAGFFGKFIKSISRIMLYRAIRSALKAIGEAFDEGLKNAYHYSQQSETFTRLADTLDRVKSITSQMVNQIGALWGEIRQFIMPAVEWLVENVRKIAEYITEFMAAINGEKTYLQAQYVEQKWDDATEAVKKYKHQLLGLDELNNLTKQESNSKKEETDYSKLYKEMPVSNKMLAIGEVWGSLWKKIKDALTEIELGLGMFMVGVGAALLFSGTNIPLGLGLIIAGGWMASKAANIEWEKVKNSVSGTLAAIEIVLGGFLLGIGAVMAFSGANIPLGIGLMLTGATALGAGLATLKWDELETKIQDRILIIAGIVGGALLVVGSILTFSGANLPLGITLMAGGALALGTAAALAWTRMSEEIKFRIGVISGIVGGALLVLGVILAFTGVGLPLAIGLILAGSAGLASSVAINWNYILDGLKGAWESIKAWWNDTVVGGVKKAVGWVEEKLHWDLNGDGTIGVAVSTTHTSSSGVSHGGTSGKFASGGIPTSGSLFYAGEAGAEFVGNIGNSAAVANTGQMTDAIYKAAYMGVSKALKENGGGGMGGFEPATMDDLFIAMRKKSNEYNMTKGSPAF